MAAIEIYVSCHKPFFVPQHPLLRPIQVGTALSDERFDGWLHDDRGDNISEKNRSYCELTAQYWAWKHSSADYVGFFHYRRYLYPDTAAKRPYILRKKPTDKLLRKLRFDDLAEFVPQYDIIAPKGEDMHVSVRSHYAQAPHHRAEDLTITEDIIRERYPDYAPAMEKYLGGTVQYFGNLFLMRRELLEKYCTWLFDILAEFDCRADWTERTAQEKRADGYLAERLFGVYLTHCTAQNRVLYLPRVHFEAEAKLRIRRQIVHFLLPPGSKRRARVKAIHGGR